MDMLDKIIAYEGGELTDEQATEMFQSMIDDGSVWSLQGHYQRTANYLLAQGICQQPETADVCDAPESHS